ILADILYPDKCIYCGVWGETVCEECVNKFERLEEPYCSICMHPVSKKSIGEAKYIICIQCQKRPRFFRKFYAPFVYSGYVKEFIHRLKYGKDYSLIPYFIRLFTETIKGVIEIDKIDWIVPVPLSKKHFRVRGFNIVKIMAERISYKKTKELITKKAEVLPQAGLSLSQRIKNPINAFSCKEEIKDKNVLVVDDIFTTGTTINECAKTLVCAGAKEVEAVAFARSVME
ncbi:MAG: ComF family protein, partial [Candidatus Hydrogenedentota bacterium]